MVSVFNQIGFMGVFMALSLSLVNRLISDCSSGFLYLPTSGINFFEWF